MGVLRQKTIARVDGLGMGGNGRADNALGVQIAFLGFRFANTDSLISQRHMQGFPVGFGIHRHSGDAHFLTGPDDPDGDLAPVGDQNFREHIISSFP